MSFLNKKEQVIEIQLTSFGKHLLSKGELDFKYYSFLDDDVLYDGSYALINNESQNDISVRIKDVPQLQPQFNFHGIETEIITNNRLIRTNNDDDVNLSRINKIQSTPEKHYALSAPLGTISLDSINAPAWSINSLQGEISGAIHYQTGSQPTLRIPQITMKPVLFTTIASPDQPLEELGGSLLQNGKNSISGAPSDLNFLLEKFQDGSFINIIEDSIVLEIEELNSTLENENFEIEIFQVKQDSKNNQQLIPLFFNNNRKSFIKNGILLEESEIQTLNNFPNLDQTCVEYFFDVFIDDEVDNSIICESANNKPDFRFQQSINCKIASPIKNNLYKSSITEEDLKRCK